MQNHISATYPDGHVETLFTPLAPYKTPEALDRICEEYNRVIGNMEVKPLIVIPIFIHDFLCIHPFNDGNGRMSRLLTTLLLYRNGFYVGKYISLEAKIAKNKDVYYDSLGLAQTGWHEGTYIARCVPLRQQRLHSNASANVGGRNARGHYPVLRYRIGV